MNTNKERNMDINNLTIGQAKELASMLGQPAPAGPYRVGDCVLIRTVTMTQVGRITAIYPGELVLEDAAWVADTGRFHEAIAKGTLHEVEAVDGRVIVGRGAIVDVFQWRHKLPLETS